MTGSVDLNPNHLGTVKAILAEHVPECEVRAFGSRATWTAKDYSDLDLAVVGEGPLDWRTLDRLKEAFEESDLPMRVDVLDWHNTSESFREVIERDYVVVREPWAEETAGGVWREVTLAELGEIDRGRSRHRPRNAAELYGGPYPFVQTGDIKASRGRVTTHRQTYSEVGLAQSRLWPAGTMVITIAANIAETAILSYPACFPDSVVGFIADESKCDVRFIEYTFRLLRNKLQHENVGTGSVQDNINLQTLDRLRFLIPPLKEQRAIAHVLGTLDDKIELNRRMNETLEGMARALFKSWFVNFEPVRAKMEGWWRRGESLPGLPAELYDVFPGRLVGSELGGVPEGWEVGTVGHLALQRKERIGHREATVLSAMASGELAKSDDVFNKRVYSTDLSKYIAVEQWDIAYNPSRINIGSIGMLKTPILGAVSPVYVVARPKRKYRWFLEFFFRNSATRNWIEILASGSVRQSLTFADFASIPCTIPPVYVVNAFDEAWSSLRGATERRSFESFNLSEQRDNLLKNLMSGEVVLDDLVEVSH